MSDSRREALSGWARDVLSDDQIDLTPASGDASFRRYFRFRHKGDTVIAMDAPPPQEDVRPFLDVTRRLLATGINVPHVHQQDVEQGFLLLDDLGNELYLSQLSEATVEALYGDALTALLALQGKGDASGLPLYDTAMLRREMALFPDWLVARQLGLTLSDQDQAGLAAVFHVLVENALEQPQRLVHRDYHSRNLLVHPRHNPGVIDYQDAVLGPVTYDLVSLLKDCYIAWPRERVQGWAMGYFEQARQHGIVAAEHESRWLRWFDLMGVQRHLKAAGIFARLNIRDGKPGYLPDIPRTLQYIVDLAESYPELQPLCALLSDKVLPALSTVTRPQAG